MSMFLESNLRGLARLLYWVSMLLLLLGGGVLIDPTHRQTGITIHIYITLAAFELYIWLLMLLARWQASKGMASDVARSGIFALVIQGLMFVAMNEMHQADANQGLVTTVVVVLLAAAKIPLACRWIGFALPAPMLLVNHLWILLMAVPALLLRQYRGERLAQDMVGYFSCWAVAALLAAHIPLAVRQAREGLRAGDAASRQWYVPWLRRPRRDDNPPALRGQMGTVGRLGILVFLADLVGRWGGRPGVGRGFRERNAVG